MTGHNRHPQRLGLLLWPQQADWADMRATVEAADAAGYDSLWTWDHLYAIRGPALQPIFEGWTTIAAWAAITSRPTLGLMVGATTFRNPGLVANSAITVDHVSGGRCVLGLGGAWFGEEHEAHGIDFFSGFGERLDHLDEAVSAISRLFRGETVDSPEDGHYDLRGLQLLPGPVRGPGRLPILIGGSGEKKTLRTVARYADAWNSAGSVEGLKHKIEVLAGHCDVERRDMAEIEFTLSAQIVIRDDAAEARRVLGAAKAHNGEGSGEPAGADEGWFGPPEAIAERWRPYLELGFTHLIGDLLTPYDRETVERLVEVRELVQAQELVR
ncbi:hypothetical protein BH20CHL6_BH20CHL6_18780 [soil metagenome]